MEYTAMIWQLANFNYDPAPVVQICRDYKIARVTIKMLQGYKLYNTDGTNEQRFRNFVYGIRAGGIEGDGWGYHTPDSGNRQGEAISERQQKYDLDRYQANCEIEWEQPYGMPAAAEALAGPIKKGGFECLMMGARFPHNFPNTPWSKFNNLEQIDGFAPMLYWMGAHNPEGQGEICLKQYREFTSKPIHLTAPTFGESYTASDGNRYYWEPSLDELERFRTWAIGAGQTRMFIYSLDWVYTHSRLDMLQALTGVTPTDPGTPPPNPGSIRIAHLGTGKTLRIRSTPNTINLSNVVAMTWNGSVFETMGAAIDAAGYTWYQIGPSAWVREDYVEVL